ncbi:DUF2884 family protein [Dokdonella sp.]|uniref:DUF2884 family protein n=1 Tax=Dokdonella sp. TaxID=2291710 RepID=UPI002F40A9C1
MFRFVCSAAVAVAGLGVAHAGIDLHGADCGLHSDYSMAVKPDALVFTRTGGSPGEVVIANGTLRVDGRVVALGAADRERVLGIEHGVRDVLPQLREIVHDAVQIAFDAVTEVSGAFAKDAEAARASAERLARTAADIRRQIDANDSLAAWKGKELDRLVDQAVGTLVAEVVGNVAGQAISVALSGDEKAAAELEARADGIDAKVERIVARRSRELAQRADAICPRLRTLARLGSELEVRPDGRRLQLARVD